MASGTAVCCLCGTLLPDATTTTCLNCLRTQVDITEALQKQVSLQFCRQCSRYLRPPWVPCDLESAELLQLCLRKIHNLNKLKLIDAAFLWTEPHSRRLKVKLTVQKEIQQGSVLEQTCVVEFIVTNLQCDDCKRTWTPHTWVANVQVRQRVPHQRTFYFLEQLILKHSAHDKVTSLKQKDQGVDFHFANKSHAARFVDFLQSVVPISVKQAKQLISQDDKSNTYNYKYTYSVEILPVCRDDVVVLPSSWSNNLGGLGPVVLCYKVSTSLHLIDPETLAMAEIQNERFWKSPFSSLGTPAQLVEFIVLNVEGGEPWLRKPQQAMEVDGLKVSPAFFHRPGFAKFSLVDVEVAREKDLGENQTTFRVRSHLGHLLKAGDTVLGYDLQTLIGNAEDSERFTERTPDVILVKKVYPKRERIFTLNRMQVDHGPKAEAQFEEFMDDLETDPDSRARINLYRKKNLVPEAVAPPPAEDFPGVRIDELLSHLTLEEAKADVPEEID